MTKVGITGHQAIPQQAVEFIQERVIDELGPVAASQSGLIGFTSLAAGADQLFADIVIAVGGQLHVVIPSAGYESTFDRAGARRYRELLEKAEEVERLEFPEPTEQAYMAAGKRIVDQVDRLLAIWDGLPSRGLGGTADIVKYAKERDRDVKLIWPAGVVR